MRRSVTRLFPTGSGVWTLTALTCAVVCGLPRAARGTTFAELPNDLQAAVQGTLAQQAELTASDGELADNFGYSAALSSDGTTALIGAP